METYNKTQLTPQNEFERHIYHRDQFAHYFRWTHVLKNAKIGQSILDFGCGSAEMLEVFYRNRFRPKKYLGVDIRQAQINKNKEKFKNVEFAEFIQIDLCNEVDFEQDFDIITSFEVLEHIGKWNYYNYIDNILFHMSDKTILYLSTPCFNGSAANNHMIKNPETGELTVGEYAYNELKELLEEDFEIINVYGTFASITDYKNEMNVWQKLMFENLRKYYDVNLLSNLMAPFFPEHSRNCLWVLKKKVENDAV